MADQQPDVTPLPPTPNPPGAVFDVRDGITVESNTGTTDELAKGLDALDKAIETEQPDTLAPVRDPDTGKFTGKQRRSSAVARMADATAKEAAAKRERDEAKAETAQLKAQLAQRAAPPPSAPRPAQAAPRPAVQPPPPEPEPNPADTAKYPAGEYDAQYLRDIGKYEARQEYQRLRADEQRAQAAEQHLRTVEHGMTTYAEKMQSAFPQDGGLDTFLATMPKEILDLRPSAVQAMLAPQTPLGPANVIADVISDAESPVALMQYLKEHPKDFQRLLTLHPIQVFREMGKLEATLAAASPPRSAPREVSRARPPVQRVESVPQLSDAPPGDDASDEEHTAYYNRKEKARRFGRG